MSSENRSLSRALAMQMLYQMEQNKDAFESYAGDFLLHCEETDGEVKALARKLAIAAQRDSARLDRLISEAADKWALNRIAPVDRAILRLGTHELVNVPEVPPKVAIDEAIELAKAYSTEDSPGFVNGILDAILKRPDLEEFKQRRELPAELKIPSEAESTTEVTEGTEKEVKKPKHRKAEMGKRIEPRRHEGTEKKAE